jgi:hypothetical protein
MEPAPTNPKRDILSTTALNDPASRDELRKVLHRAGIDPRLAHLSPAFLVEAWLAAILHVASCTSFVLHHGPSHTLEYFLQYVLPLIYGPIDKALYVQYHTHFSRTLDAFVQGRATIFPTTHNPYFEQFIRIVPVSDFACIIHFLIDYQRKNDLQSLLTVPVAITTIRSFLATASPIPLARAQDVVTVFAGYLCDAHPLLLGIVSTLKRTIAASAESPPPA